MSNVNCEEELLLTFVNNSNSLILPLTFSVDVGALPRVRFHGRKCIFRVFSLTEKERVTFTSHFRK